MAMVLWICLLVAVRCPGLMVKYHNPTYCKIMDRVFLKMLPQNIAKALSNVGFVKSALWQDLDGDGDKDLLLALEWDGICAFINNKEQFEKKVFDR